MTDDEDTIPRTQFEKAVADLLAENPDMDAIALAMQVPLALGAFEDQYSENRDPCFSFDTNARIHFYREFAGLSYVDLWRLLDQNPEITRRFGVHPADVPEHNSTINRGWTNRLSPDCRDHIERRVRLAVEVIRELGHPVGARIDVSSAADDETDETEEKSIGEMTEDVLGELGFFVESEFDFDQPEGAKADAETVIGIEAVAALEKDSAIEEATEMYKGYRRQNDEPLDVPSGETVLDPIKEFSVQTLLDNQDDSLDRIFRKLRQSTPFSIPVATAVDTTKIPYWGENLAALVFEDEDGVTRQMWKKAPEDEDHPYYIEIATLVVVGNNPKVTLAMTPMWHGRSHGEVVRDLIWRAREHVPIHRVYADRAFFSADVLLSLDEAGVIYKVAAPRTKGTKRIINRMQKDVKVEEDYPMLHKDMPDDYFRTTVVALPAQHDESKTVLFATNEEMVDDAIRLDRERTVEIFSEYSDRGAIENTYKQFKKFLPWTSSCEYIIRHFHYTFTIILQALRYLVDRLVQLRLDKEVRTKPRVTSGVFAQEARNHFAVIL